MDFNIKVRRNEEKVIVLEMSGKLRLGEPVTLLQQTIQTQMQLGERNFLLDISGVTSVDSFALGQMVASVTTVRSSGGSLTMTGLNARSNDVIRMTGLEPVFNSPSQTAPHRRNTLWKNLGIAFAIIAVGTAFYWIALNR